MAVKHKTKMRSTSRFWRTKDAWISDWLIFKLFFWNNQNVRLYWHIFRIHHPKSTYRCFSVTSYFTYFLGEVSGGTWLFLSSEHLRIHWHIGWPSFVRGVGGGRNFWVYEPSQPAHNIVSISRIDRCRFDVVSISF